MRSRHEPSPATVTLMVDGHAVTVVDSTTVYGAISQRDTVATTRLSVLGQARAAFCGMGICHECRVTIDGIAHVLACQTLCTAGMDVRTGEGTGTGAGTRLAPGMGMAA